MTTDQEIINQRASIWEALSELYIDTELSKQDLERISKTFLDTQLDLVVLKNIDLYEVFPVLQTNLLAPAGIWTGFDQPWLHQKCLHQYRKRNNTFHQLHCRFLNTIFYRMRKRYWLTIEKIMEGSHNMNCK